MNDKGIEILKKVKSDLEWCERRLRVSTDEVEKEILLNVIAKEKAWLAEWDLQNKVAMKNNCKR